MILSQHFLGNRATATATVTVYDTLPISTPTHETSPKPTSASPSRSTYKTDYRCYACVEGL